jgi:hypothetical protein
MIPIFQDRISRRLIFWSVLLFMAAAILPTQDHLAIDIGGQHRIITRQDNPMIYWGVESEILFVATSLCAYAFYRNRKK